jgi:hypothetical protein
MVEIDDRGRDGGFRPSGERVRRWPGRCERDLNHDESC